MTAFERIVEARRELVQRQVERVRVETRQRQVAADQCADGGAHRD